MREGDTARTRSFSRAMNIAEHHQSAYSGAGLFIGAFAWATSAIVGAAYADYSCALRIAISIMAAGVFGLAIVFQLAASGVFSGCER